MRFLVVVFLLVWCGLAIASAVRADSASSIIGVLAIMVFGLAFGLRLLGIAAIAAGDELLVRNAYRTRRLQRSDIEGFRLGTATLMPFKRTIHVLLPDETVALEVGLLLFYIRGGGGALEDRLHQLQGWLAASA